MVVGVSAYVTFDFRTVLDLRCTRPEAEQIARQTAEAFQYSPVGLKPNVVFQHTPTFQEIARRRGVRGARALVDSGIGFAWRIDFTPSGGRRGPGWREPGVSVRLDAAGRLIEFRSAPFVSFLPADPGTARKQAADLVGREFGPGLTLGRATVSEVADLPGMLEVKWTKVSGTSGLEEEVGAVLARDQVLHLYRRVISSSRIQGGPGYSGLLNRAGTFLQVGCLLSVYLYAIRMLLKARRSGSLPWRVPLAISFTAAASIAWLLVAMAPFSAGGNVGNRVTTLSLAMGFISYIVLVPATSGLVFALRERDYDSVADLEQVLQLRMPSPKVYRTFTDGVASGILLAGIYMLGTPIVVPEVGLLEMGITADTPLMFGQTALVLCAGLFALVIVGVFRLVQQSLQRPYVAGGVTAVAVVVLSADFDKGFQFATEAMVTAAVTVCTIVAHHMAGFPATIISIATAFLIVSAIVGLSVGNHAFWYQSITMLGIPALFLVGSIAGCMLTRLRARRV